MTADSSQKTPSRTPSESAEGRRGKKLVRGLAFGIGSAAIVAALLFANRSKGKGSSEEP